MTLAISSTSLKSRMDGAQPNTIADAFRIVQIGSVLRALLTSLRKKNPVAAGASPYDLATLHVVQLPDDAKAHSISRAYVRAGGVTGELAVVAPGVTPTTGQCAVTPAGNLAFLAADAITNVDAVYQPEKYDAFEATLTVTANVLTLPPGLVARGVVSLMEAEGTLGTAAGKKIVLVPGAGAPAAGQARLNIAKSTVTFAVADAITQARVKFAVASLTDVDALLEAASSVM